MQTSYRLLLVLFLLALSVVAVWPAVGMSQICGPTYQTVYRTVYDPVEVTAYRIEYETVYDQRQVTSYRPVTETRYRRECYTVSKPVVQTAYRTECHTVMEPVVTTRTEYVDQGCFVDQTVFRPCPPAVRLRWTSPGCAVDPVTGATTYQRPGLYWVQVPRGRYEVQRVWRPNMVAHQVQQTCYRPKTVSRQVPVQVCRYVQEQKYRDVPYQVCRMEPVQTTVSVPRCVEKRIPVTYTTCRPRVVCERVPVDPCGVPLSCAIPSVCEPACEVTEIPGRPTPAGVGPQRENGEAPAISPGEDVPDSTNGEEAPTGSGTDATSGGDAGKHSA